MAQPCDPAKPCEECYLRAECEGKLLSDLLCEECPDTNSCAAVRECHRAEDEA